jgi:hypothetical protein
MLQFPVSRKAEPPLLRIEPFKGINLAVTPTQIDNSQSPDMLNVHTDERGSLNKRTGYERVYYKSLGEGNINGLFHYNKPDGSETILFSHQNKLYETVGIPNLANNSRLQTWEDDDLYATWEGDL